MFCPLVLISFLKKWMEPQCFGCVQASTWQVLIVLSLEVHSGWTWGGREDPHTHQGRTKWTPWLPLSVWLFATDSPSVFSKSSWHGPFLSLIVSLWTAQASRLVFWAFPAFCLGVWLTKSAEESCSYWPLGNWPVRLSRWIPQLSTWGWGDLEVHVHPDSLISHYSHQKLDSNTLYQPPFLSFHGSPGLWQLQQSAQNCPWAFYYLLYTRPCPSSWSVPYCGRGPLSQLDAKTPRHWQWHSFLSSLLPWSQTPTVAGWHPRSPPGFPYTRVAAITRTFSWIK